MSKRKYSTQSGPTYEDLSKIYTDEEIVDAFVLPSSRTAEERAVVRRKLREEINKQEQDETSEEKMIKSLRSMYVRQLFYLKNAGKYDPALSFPNQLKRYIKITNNNQTTFGRAIGLEKTRISKLVNGKLNPTTTIIHRLAFHGGNIITAKQWMQLHQRDQLQTMMPDHPEAVQSAVHVTPAVR